MNKVFPATLLITSMFLIGCAGNQEKQAPLQPTESISKSYTFKHELFSLELPATYSVADGVIQPQSAKDFPQIVFGISNDAVDANKLLETEEAWVANLCGQTDACGKIIGSEVVIIDGKNALKSTVQYQGRSLDDTSGYSNEYHYSFVNAGHFFRFWTSADDLENQEEVSEAFDSIMGTVLFQVE